MKVRFLTYATLSFKKNALNFAKNALNVGFHSATVLTPEDIFKTDFYGRNEQILKQGRGAGYWLWKPFIILETLKKMPADEVLFYCDAGRSNYYNFTRFPKNLIKKILQISEGFLLGPPQSHLAIVQNWTKRDCLVLMGMDKEQFLNKGQLTASWSLWTNTNDAKEFLGEWISYCEDSRCLTDEANVCGLPNYKEFQEHRHDQAILTLLALKRNAPYLNFEKTCNLLVPY